MSHGWPGTPGEHTIVAPPPPVKISCAKTLFGTNLHWTVEDPRMRVELYEAKGVE